MLQNLVSISKIKEKYGKLTNNYDIVLTAARKEHSSHTG